MAERSLLAAVSGIDANQTLLDEIGDNIANADTVGYKAGQVEFGDLLSEQIAGATAPAAGSGGTNPVAVGSGVLVTSVGTDLTEGSLESTGNPNDVAIQGAGYLVVDKGGQQLYTRDGALTPDAAGNLTVDGGVVMGWAANAAGTINTNAPLTAIQIPTGQTIGATATTELTLGGNLPAWDGVGTPPQITVTTYGYDALGAVVPVTFTFTGVVGTANQWTIQGTVPNPGGGTDDLFTATTLPTMNSLRRHIRGQRHTVVDGRGHAGRVHVPDRRHVEPRFPGARLDRRRDPVRQPTDARRPRPGRLPGRRAGELLDQQ
jgi:flagellar hook protein FlgE